MPNRGNILFRKIDCAKSIGKFVLHLTIWAVTIQNEK